MPPTEKIKSRQQRWQEKQYKLKRCATCAAPVENNTRLCAKHQAAASERLRVRRGATKRYTTLAQWQKVDWSEPVETIANKMGVRPSTVRWRRSILGKTCSKPRVALFVWQQTDWSQTPRAIAEQLGLCISTVYHWRRRVAKL